MPNIALPDHINNARFVAFIAKFKDCFAGERVSDQRGRECILEWADMTSKEIALWAVGEEGCDIAVIPIWGLSSYKGVAAPPLPG